MSLSSSSDGTRDRSARDLGAGTVGPGSGRYRLGKDQARLRPGHVVVAAQTGVSGSSVIENGVIIGGQVGIADHVHIEAGAILGAQSGIPSNKVIRGKGIVFWGTPARPIKEYLKDLAILARLRKKEK